MVVTGSRVISNIANSPTPLTALSASDLSQMTPTSVSDALVKLPVLSGSTFPRQAYQNLTILNLRNFGGNRTLVLMDGHRVTPSLQDGTVGIETLPMTLMTRTDVVTGGASAVYGSDAVTGVVNFILDKAFTGVKLDVNGGISTYGDGASFKIDAAAGTSLFGGRGHIEVAVSSRQTRPGDGQCAPLWLAALGADGLGHDRQSVCGHCICAASHRALWRRGYLVRRMRGHRLQFLYVRRALALQPGKADGHEQCHGGRRWRLEQMGQRAERSACQHGLWPVQL